jgi:2-polyprenyl-6-methoxyphenol hydroxylase-like FAD-dependent oxidoreductase
MGMGIEKAIVVGGGIAGLVCARALALRGMKTTLLERKTVMTDEGGIGIGLRSNAMNALAELGLAEQCVSQGVAVEEIRISQFDGTTTASYPPRRYMDTRWPGFTGIGRAALHAILVQGANDAGVIVESGAEVKAVEQGDASVGVIDTRGRRWDSDILIIADGIHSKLRAQIFPNDAVAKPTGEGVWRGLVKGISLKHIELIYGGSVGTVGFTPMRDDVYLYAVDRASNAPPTDVQDLTGRFIQLLAGYSGAVSDLLRHLSRNPRDVSYRRLESVSLTPPWHKGRVLFIGDAAHAGPPTLALGAALGIEDGVVLAQCTAQTGTVGECFALFMDRRYERVRTIVEASIMISSAQMTPGGREQMRLAEAAAEAQLSRSF